MKQSRLLRTGFTTGSCASAAAKAAAVFLLTGKSPETVEIHLPDGQTAAWEPRYFAESGWGVRKDAGDDPDVTDGAWICASVKMVDGKNWEKLLAHGYGYFLEEFPDFYLDGGTGIGIAQLPGLSCPVGHYAINPVPRRMILSAVAEACTAAGWEGRLHVTVSIPEGAVLAEKTFNPRVGIRGGISVLGTTGIVEPMSETALLETIRLEIHMKAVFGLRRLLMTPGNYGETFLLETLGVPLGEAVKCSNFVADAVETAASEGFTRMLFVGHIGKLVKVAGGVRNTHSAYGDRRMELMETLTREALDAGADGEDLLGRIRGCNTTEEAVGILVEVGLAQAVLTHTAVAVKRWMEHWSQGKTTVEVIVFSSAYGIAGMTERETWIPQGVL
ncbi:MAG: cobalt-precorrin-5B (C(1))-methyltransferase CbiD [Clostridiales bacterium]|nr:cobalt-precorrin-5B (C(1))-methyltransferase CbiD [Clostridiales bacterium]